jgi:tellurite resistance protein TerC
VIKIKEALLWSGIFIGVALIFNVLVYIWYDHEKAFQFLTAFVIEKALSVDNIFVFLMLFTYFRVPQQYEHKVLFWGILGAIAMRAVFIFAGIALIQMFHWILYIFGVFLIITGLKMAFKSDEEIHPDKNFVLRLFRKFVPVTKNYQNGHFFIRQGKYFAATPLFVVLIAIETTDLIFAIDSIPAVLAISSDPFIVYTSNIFAILGLRALYFALAGFMKLFQYLHYGLSLILVFIGVKMLLPEEYKIPIPIVLGLIVGILTLSILVSIWLPKKDTDDPEKENEK